jgi:hypothetical protein
MPGSASRRLIQIPIIHTQADLGTLGVHVRDLYVRRAGRRRWEEHIRTVERLWHNLGDALGRLELDPPRTRLYQDGLPVCGREEDIVRELAAAGSCNHRILLDLMAKGCHLTGTESPELLLEEYNLTRAQLEQRARRPRPGSAGAQACQSLLDRRDRFIADRIAHTLEEGWTGILFLGMLHALAHHLPADIQVLRLDETEVGPCSPVC